MLPGKQAGGRRADGEWPGESETGLCVGLHLVDGAAAAAAAEAGVVFDVAVAMMLSLVERLGEGRGSTCWS